MCLNRYLLRSEATGWEDEVDIAGELLQMENTNMRVCEYVSI